MIMVNVSNTWLETKVGFMIIILHDTVNDLKV